MGQIFDRIYDLAMSTRPYKKYAQSYYSLFKDHSHCNVLEAGCGSGLFLEAMENFNIKPVGLDIDQDMLKIAKKRVTNKLILGDIRSFSSEIKWDVIYLPLDVLNYLSYRDLQKALRNLAKMLKEGALLIFDVHGKKRLRTMHNAISTEKLTSGSYKWKSRVRGRRVFYTIDCQEENDIEIYKLKQRIHTKREIIQAAKKAGLIFDRYYQAWDLKKPDRNSDRLIYVFRFNSKIY